MWFQNHQAEYSSQQEANSSHSSSGCRAGGRGRLAVEGLYSWGWRYLRWLGFCRSLCSLQSQTGPAWPQTPSHTRHLLGWLSPQDPSGSFCFPYGVGILNQGWFCGQEQLWPQDCTEFIGALRVLHIPGIRGTVSLNAEAAPVPEAPGGSWLPAALPQCRCTTVSYGRPSCSPCAAFPVCTGTNAPFLSCGWHLRIFVGFQD